MVGASNAKWRKITEGYEDIGGFDDGDFYGLEELDPNEFPIEVSSGNTKKPVKPKNSKDAKGKGAKDGKKKNVKAKGTETSNIAEGRNNIETVSSQDEDQVVKTQPAKNSKSKLKSKPKSKKIVETEDVKAEAEEAEEADVEEESKAEAEEAEVETDSIDNDEEIETQFHQFDVLASMDEEETAYSLGSWPSGLDPRIYTSLKNQKFLSPTKIQAESIPVILDGRDVIGKAATGSGKTLAYSLPLLQRFYKDPENCDKRPEGLIISPTRELAHQIRDHIQACVPAEFKHRIVAVTGGLAIQKQLRLLQKGPIIVSATPGRLSEVLENMPATEQQEWQKIPTLVLDEADRLLKSGSFAELESCLRVIGVSKQRQVLVYSATFSTDLWANLARTKSFKIKPSAAGQEDMIEIMRKKIGLNNVAAMIDADPESNVANAIKQAIIEAPNMEKDLYLYYFSLLYPGKTIAFVNSIHAVKRLVPLLKELGMQAIGVHSDMIQKQRLRSIERFKQMKNPVLVATDVAARGLDVPFVDHVVHYNLPRTADMYVHRSGRTARAGNEGVSVVLCSPQEKSGPLPNLLKLIHSKPQHLEVDYDILEQLRERVKLAKDIADTRLNSAKQGKTDAWLAQAAADLGVDVEDDEDAASMLKELQRGNGKTKSSSKPRKLETSNLPALTAELQKLLQQKLGKNQRYLTSGTRNLAHEMMAHPDALILGKPVMSALNELKDGKTRKRKAV
ncbi:putative ATP-dependent RNA helicase [Starmerella bacillaris]|uniref:RNA helicase n=1 Tax=Starmerella bacillaris TaxID=1247836 RepID=A0AAV5RFT1_STABA|nr:putative ATP-dependent RNA helicase [Starmerella bacillaris]